MTDPFDAELFGSEAGAPNPAFTHIQTPSERRAPAPGPAAVGDVRGQRAGGGLATVAEANATTGVGADIAGAAAAPGLTGDFGGGRASEVAPGVAPGVSPGAAGVHFVQGLPTPGRVTTAQQSAELLAGTAPTSGPRPAGEGSRSLVGSGFGAVPAKDVSGLGSRIAE
jgi:hypothetical protein